MKQDKYVTLSFQELYKDKEVYIERETEENKIEYIKGRVVDCSDIHNVEVDYYSRGYGIFCLNVSCKEYDPIYKKVA